jgi:predicted ATPase/transcriptional regulator with XRE-family HTH domain
VTLGSFGDLLRKHRLAAGLTQEAVAERAGLSVNGIQKLERGSTHPYRDTAQRLLRALQLSPEEEAVFRTLAQPPGRQRREGNPDPAPGSASARRDLPAALTSFIGRGREITEVGALLSSARLITLTGVGGCGKTRLALEVARLESDGYPDGVWLVELAPLTDVALVPQAVASALGVREVPSQPLVATLAATLKSCRLLLVLDNCEHLLDACAHLADALLRACPRIQILATSREALGLTGEVSWRVPSLAVPPMNPLPPAERIGEYAAVQLFVERAHAAQSHFVVTPRNAAHLAQICHRLDGIPLALELAAVRVRGMSVEEVAARLDQRFRLLTGGSRAALPRQQTLRATIEWSYQLLGHTEQLLFARLSVFVESWTLAAAEIVCSGQDIGRDEVLDLVLHLVDKSLVVAEEDGSETQRYRLLETLRQFGREQLVAGGQATSTHDQHAAYFVEQAKRAESDLPQPSASAWMERLALEEGDFGAALEWLMAQGGVQPALHLAGMLGRLWAVRGYLREGRRRLATLLALPEVEAPTLARARVLDAAGVLAMYQIDRGSALALFKESLALYRQHQHERGTAWVLIYLGWLCSDSGHHKAARRFLQQALGICRRLGDRPGIARCLNILGILAYAAGNLDLSLRLHTESLSIAREIDDRWGTAWALHRLSVTLLVQVEAGQVNARSIQPGIHEALAIWHELGERRHFAYSMSDLGSAAALVGDFDNARVHLRESLLIFAELDERLGVVWALAAYAMLFDAEGNPARAVKICGAIMARVGAIGVAHGGTPVPFRDRIEHYHVRARATLGADPVAIAWTEGQAMSLEEAAAYAQNPDA